MKYILTESQYNLIVERLGVPDEIHEAAVKFYDIFVSHLKSITEKKDEYVFNGYVNIVLGKNKKILIDEYEFTVNINEIETENKIQISSLGMAQQFSFDEDIMFKKAVPSTNAEFSIDFVVPTDWKPSDLLEEFVKDKSKTISDLSHELKHKYDKQIKKIDLIGREVRYQTIKSMPHFKIPVLDTEFRYYMYYTDIAENLVRATEIASEIKDRDITKKDFIEFLKNNDVFQKLLKIRSFTYEDLIEGLKKYEPRVDEILIKVNIDVKNLTQEEKFDTILKLFYVNLFNTKMKVFKMFIEMPTNSLKSFISNFIGVSKKKELKMNKFIDKFYNRAIRYHNNPKQFFIDEINKFHYVSNNIIKKIGKLYDMAKDDKLKTESIVNWDLYLKVKEQKSPSKIEKEFKKIK